MYGGGMAAAGSIEVPVTPKMTIPFHAGELIRVEMDRTTIVDGHAIRPRDCQVIIDEQRVLGCQAAVVVDEGPLRKRTIGVVIKTGRRGGAGELAAREIAEQLEALLSEPETARHAVSLVIGHPFDGSDVRRYEVTDARMIASQQSEQPPRAEGGWSRRWVRFDFTGVGPELELDT